MIDLKPCPFCGGEAHIYGEEYRACLDGKYAPGIGHRYWVQTHCAPWCLWANTRSMAYGVLGGVEYETPEAAAEAWNRRKEQEG